MHAESGVVSCWAVAVCTLELLATTTDRLPRLTYAFAARETVITSRPGVADAAEPSRGEAPARSVGRSVPAAATPPPPATMQGSFPVAVSSSPAAALSVSRSPVLGGQRGRLSMPQLPTSVLE